MIIDLDAHQGNGYERDLLKDSEAYIVDFYNHRIYPGDSYAKEAIHKDVPISPGTTDA
jgi:histone deacetylase 11